jgi:predicted ATP-grasp superfamily ATP-dependent carboligase/ubiquinone/menaquinone biosynthesis C-methylase UbiE
MPEDRPADVSAPVTNRCEESRSTRNSYFRSVADHWEKLYREENLKARIYQERKDVALGWIQKMLLPPGARILDLGCGAGFTAVALAKQGYRVDALDGEQTMLDMTSRRAQAAGVSLTAALGDAQELKFDQGTFDLVVALGLVPWLHSPHQALSEIRRVLKPGGFLVVSSDNRWRLTNWFDPMCSPAVARCRKLLASALRQRGWMPMPDTPPSTMQSTREFDRWLIQAGFNRTNSVTIGFGYFTLLRRNVLPDRFAAKLHRWLQGRAYAGWPVLRRSGAHYLVAATNSGPGAGEQAHLSARNTRQAEPHGYDVSTPLVLLGANTHGSLGIMRSLGRMGVPVHAVYSPPRGPASFSAYCKSAVAWDFARAHPEHTVSFLLDFAQQIGKRCILIPTWDELAVFAAEYYDILKSGFIYPHQSGQLAQSLCSKKEMAALARQFGVPTPEVVFPQSMQDVSQYIETARFPVMLKGIDGNLLKERTGKKMAIVYSPRQLQEMYQAMETPERPNLMLQEYIPGGDDSIWMFNGYFNAKSECLLGFTGRKLRQTPIHTGMTSLGVCLRNEVVESTTKDFMHALGYKGILDIGYRYDPRDGRYKVLDVNPRIGATFRLFVAGNGMDVARALYLDLTGQQVPPSQPREGRKWFVELDLKSCIDYHREGNLTLRQWLRSLRGIEEAGYFAWDDLKPFRKLCFRAISELAHAARQWTRSRFWLRPSRASRSLGDLEPTVRPMDTNPATEQSKP